MNYLTPALYLYRGLLWLYPAEFRDHFAREMCRTLSDLLREKPGFAEVFGLYLGVMIDAPKEHSHMIRQDLTYALRTMRKEKLTTAIATLVLALGIGSITTVFTLFNGMMLRPLPYPEQERLVYVEEFKAGELSAAVSYSNFVDMLARNRSFEAGATFGSGLATLRGEVEAERVQGTAGSGALLRLLGVPPLLGRVFDERDDVPKAPAVVVLGEDLWRRRYGADASLVGKSIILGSEPALVIGVMPSGFHFPDQSELWYPLQGDPKEGGFRRTDHGPEAIARLRPGVSREQAETDLRGIMDQITREHPTETYRQTVNVLPYRDRNTRRIQPVLYTLLGAVGFVLLIACANIVNLLLVRGSVRTREIAVRGALGASRSRLVRQFMVESALLGAGGAVSGALLSWIAVPALLSLAPQGFLPSWMSFKPDWTVLAFVIAITTSVAVVVAAAPAISASRLNVIEALKEGGRSQTSGGRRAWFRSALVVAEVAMSVLLLAGAGLMVRTFFNLASQKLGYRIDDIVSFQTGAPSTRYKMGPDGQELTRAIVRELRSIPGVVSAAGSTGVPILDGWGRSFTAEGAPFLSLKDAPVINHTVVTPGYFTTLGLPLLEGRDFDEHDGKNPMVTIVDEGIAKKYWPNTTAIGKRVRFGPPEDNEPWHTIIGVVGIARNQTPRDLRRNSVYLPQGEWQFPSLAYLVRVTPGLADPVPAIRSRIAAIDRNIVINRVMTLKDAIGRAVWQERFFAAVFAGFGGIALLLALVGLYGVMAYAVSLRTHEMGIRMALGARAGEIRAMILKQSGVLIGAGLLLGVGGAIFLTRLMTAQLYEVRPGDPLTLTGVALLLIVAGLAASYFPARTATRVDPINALRAE